MRYATVMTDAGPAVGIVADGSVRVLQGTGGVDHNAFPLGVLQVIGRPDTAAGPPIALDTVRVLAPIPRPRRNIFCVGQNYRQHSAEFDRSGFNAGAGAGEPDHPVVFTKPASSVVGPDAPIPWHPEVSEMVDYEAELAVIIGRGGRGIPVQDAMSHVWGYTIVNDVTARDVQRKHRQWFLGKSLDGFCPMGPFAVTADEVDVANLDIECWVNDELRQRGSTADLIFDVPHLIATLSAGMSLEPGDVIATGTPAGVGVGFEPPRFLRPGDRVAISVTGLGRLENTVGAGPGESATWPLDDATVPR